MSHETAGTLQQLRCRLPSCMQIIAAAAETLRTTAGAITLCESSCRGAAVNSGKHPSAAAAAPAERCGVFTWLPLLLLLSFAPAAVSSVGGCRRNLDSSLDSSSGSTASSTASIMSADSGSPADLFRGPLQRQLRKKQPLRQLHDKGSLLQQQYHAVLQQWQKPALHRKRQQQAQQQQKDRLQGRVPARLLQQGQEKERNKANQKQQSPAEALRTKSWIEQHHNVAQDADAEEPTMATWRSGHGSKSYIKASISFVDDPPAEATSTAKSPLGSTALSSSGEEASTADFGGGAARDTNESRASGFTHMRPGRWSSAAASLLPSRQSLMEKETILFQQRGSTAPVSGKKVAEQGSFSVPRINSGDAAKQSEGDMHNSMSHVPRRRAARTRTYGKGVAQAAGLFNFIQLRSTSSSNGRANAGVPQQPENHSQQLAKKEPRDQSIRPHGFTQTNVPTFPLKEAHIAFPTRGEILLLASEDERESRSPAAPTEASVLLSVQQAFSAANQPADTAAAGQARVGEKAAFLGTSAGHKPARGPAGKESFRLRAAVHPTNTKIRNSIHAKSVLPRQPHPQGPLASAVPLSHVQQQAQQSSAAGDDEGNAAEEGGSEDAERGETGAAEGDEEEKTSGGEEEGAEEGEGKEEGEKRTQEEEDAEKESPEEEKKGGSTEEERQESAKTTQETKEESGGGEKEEPGAEAGEATDEEQREKKSEGASCTEIEDREKCTLEPSCFHDEVYHQCFFNCTMLATPDDCKARASCRYEELLPRHACVNEGYQSTSISIQSFEGILRGCEEFRTKAACDLMTAASERLQQKGVTVLYKCQWLEDQSPESGKPGSLLQLQEEDKAATEAAKEKGGTADEEDPNSEENHTKKEPSVSSKDKEEEKNETDKEAVKISPAIGGVSLCVNMAEVPTSEGLTAGSILAEKQRDLREVEERKNVSAEKVCPFPEALAANAKLEPARPFYAVGETIEVECLPDHTLVGARRVITCEGKDGFSPRVECISTKHLSSYQLKYVNTLEKYANFTSEHPEIVKAKAAEAAAAAVAAARSSAVVCLPYYAGELVLHMRVTAR